MGGPTYTADERMYEAGSYCQVDADCNAQLRCAKDNLAAYEFGENSGRCVLPPGHICDGYAECQEGQGCIVNEQGLYTTCENLKSNDEDCWEEYECASGCCDVHLEPHTLIEHWECRVPDQTSWCGYFAMAGYENTYNHGATLYYPSW